MSRFAAALLLSLLGPMAAFSAQRTFVSAASGSDSNPCTRALPCRNFAAALVQTDVNGEIVVLDSGGYGVVTVDKAAALIAPAGVHAAITAFSGNALHVDALDTEVVILRGLYLNGLGATNGINFITGKTLHVENCITSGFLGPGLRGAADNAEVYVTDTITRQNQVGASFESLTSIKAHLDSVRAEENSSHGISASSGSVVTATRSVAAGNAMSGFISLTSTGVLNIESCTSTMNGVGVRAVGTTRVRNSLISGNTTGVQTDMGGNSISFGNNGLHGNGTEGMFSTTIALQ